MINEERELMKSAAGVVVKEVVNLAIVMSVLCLMAPSQTANVHAKPITDADIQLLREDVQSVKEQIITDTMTFNDNESAAFWPVYKRYAEAQHSIAVKRLAVITDYAQNLDRMDDTKARSLTDRMFSIEDETQTLRKEYFPRFEKALGAKRAAKFYQVDNRLSQMINLQLASEVPLIP
jgi:hypothetical protein